MIKAIIFDFDGVLVLSEKPRFHAIQKSALNHGVKIDEEKIKKMIGITTENFLDKTLSKSEKTRIPNIIAEYERDYKDNIINFVEPIEITVNYVKQYKGNLVFALASMGSRKTIEALTKHFGIYDHFKSIISKEEVIQHKPNPEVYIKTANKLQIDPSECAAIEDTVVGVKAALNANIKCYILLNGFNNKSDFKGLPIAGYITNTEELENIS